MADPLDDLEKAVAALVSGSGSARTFTMAPDALDSAGIRDLVGDSFPLTDGKWVLTAVDGPRRQGDAVVLTGTSTTLLGIAAPCLDLSFDLADEGKRALLVVLTPGTWNLGVSFPSWKTTAPALVGLVFDKPRLEWSSATRPTASVGLNLVADAVLAQGTLAALAGLHDLRLRDPRGAISGGDPPTARITTRPPAPLSVGGLSLPLTFTAVAPKEPCLEFASTVVVGHGVPDIPVSMRARELHSDLTLDGDLGEVTRYALSAFADFLHGARVAELVRDVFTVPETVGLRHLGVDVGLSPVRLTSVVLGIGTGKALDVVPGQVTIPDVGLTFTVEDPAGSKIISALLAGTFRFLDAYDVGVLAHYAKSAITFTGALDTPIPLSEIARKYLPDTTWLPDLTLDRLEVSAELRDKRYSFGLTVASAWSIPVGAAAVHLTEGALDLAYESGVGYDGALTGEATLTGRGSEQVASFTASVAVRSTRFELKGEVSEVSLAKLADAFTEPDVITTSGLPEITLRNSTVAVRRTDDSGRESRMTGTTSYEFSAATSIHVEKFGQAKLLFAARRTGSAPVLLAFAGTPAAAPGQTGFLVGVVVAPDWNPKSIWSALGAVFDHVTVRDATLVLSSDRWTEPFPDLDRLPYPVEQGVTFAGSLLTEKALSVLSKVLPSAAELDLAAHINTKEPLKSDISATLPHPGTIRSVEFTKLVVDLAPTKFKLEADVTFTVHGENLHLAGRGSIGLEPPTLELSVSVEQWKNPFGISGLTVDEFGLDVAVDDIGLSIGLIGTFLIGTEPNAFTLTVGGQLTDFEEPNAFVFGLDPTSRELTLARIVGQFTGTDLDHVPLLDDIAISRLDCYVVADPNGWTAPDGHLYPKGFGLNADVRFFDWVIKLKAVLGDKGIIAAGSIDPAVKFRDLFVLSDRTGKTGPHIDIDTTVIGQPGRTYFDASGRVELLGLSETFSGHATSTGFSFSFNTDLADIFRTTVTASLSAKKGFAASFDGVYDFDLTLQGGVVVGGITVIPKGVRIHGPDASLSVTCAVSEETASLHAGLSFTWSEVRLSPDMDLAISVDVLAHLGQAIATWISEHALEFFKAVLDDVATWLGLLLRGALWIGQSAVALVKVLYLHFRQSVADIADDLLKLGKHDIDTLAEALVDVCGITLSEALKLLEKNCAVTKAANAL